MDNTESIKGPSKLKYIGVFILFGILQNVLSAILALILVGYLVSGPEDLNTFFVVFCILTIPIYAGSFVFIYNFFNSSNIRKVMIYIYILGTFGVFYTIGSVKEDLEISSQEDTVLQWSTILCFVVSCILIRSYYVNKSDRWY